MADVALSTAQRHTIMISTFIRVQKRMEAAKVMHRPTGNFFFQTVAFDEDLSREMPLRR